MTGGLLPLALTAGYLALLSAIALLVERRPRLGALARHPITVALALGVYATSWTFYGGVGFAHTHGYVFLAISIGAALSCLAIPILWRPLARLVRRRGLQSPADLLAYRYQSRLVGAAVTLFLVAGILPYLSLQMRAVTEAADDLTPLPTHALVGPAYAILLSLFAVALGVRYAEPRPDRPGLVATLAVESLIKTLAITLVGLAALHGFFGGLGPFADWLAARPDALAALYRPVLEGPWAALITVAFVAAFLLPRQFHVAFVERGDDATLRHAMWVLPLLLLALNLPLPILYFAGRALAGPDTPPDVYVLAAVEHPLLKGIAFLGGISASSAMILVTSIALGGMIVNHLVLPLTATARLTVRRLTTLRRAVMVTLIFAGLALHLALPPDGPLADLGLVSFTAVLQLLPGVLGALFWPRATRRGLLAGLAGGATIWTLHVIAIITGDPGLARLAGHGLGDDPREIAIWASLTLNALLYIALSLTAPAPRRSAAAAACADDDLPHTARHHTPDALTRRLALLLGPDAARSAIDALLRDLGLPPTERRPLELARLADRAERALSALVGPLAARALVGRDDDAPAALAAELRFVQADTSPRRGGLEAALDRVQRYLGAVLDEIPEGICALDERDEIAVWNPALARRTAIPIDTARGARLDDLPPPYGPILRDARACPGQAIERTLGDGHPRILRLRCALITEPDRDPIGAVILIEDLTRRRQLRAQAAHQDRLASVGRLAAGVAHEIRNPLTGMLMVAQNLRAEPAADDLEDRLDLIIGEGRRIDAIVRTLLGFSRADDDPTRALAPEPVDLRALAHEAINLVRLGPHARRLHFTTDIPDATATLDRQRITQVLINLLANARDAAATRVDLTARLTDRTLTLDITDDGPGVPAALRERIFEPFFTTKPPGEGTGLGLAVSHRIIEEHGGRLELLDAPPTTCRVTLPA
ncbi:MAG: ATP-binding protein [bacterium]